MFKKKEAKKLRILFVDQKNDYVSQIAEHYAKEMFFDLYEVYSAGPEPDFVDCEMISSLYQNGEDIRTAVSKGFDNDELLPKDGEYDYVIYLEKPVFDEYAPKSPWQGRQIFAPMRLRSEYTATDDLELFQDYTRTMEEVRAWVKENMREPEGLKSLVSA